MAPASPPSLRLCAQRFVLDLTTLNLVRSFFNSTYVVIFLTACKPNPYFY
jgi:hypothetical protein